MGELKQGPRFVIFQKGTGSQSFKSEKMPLVHLTVHKLVNPPENKRYIGSSSNILNTLLQRNQGQWSQFNGWNRPRKLSKKKMRNPQKHSKEILEGFWWQNSIETSFLVTFWRESKFQTLKLIEGRPRTTFQGESIFHTFTTKQSQVLAHMTA